MDELERLQSDYKRLCAEFETLVVYKQSSIGQIIERQHLEKKIEYVVLRLRELTQKLKPKEL